MDWRCYQRFINDRPERDHYRQRVREIDGKRFWWQRRSCTDRQADEEDDDSPKSRELFTSPGCADRNHAYAVRYIIYDTRLTLCRYSVKHSLYELYIHRTHFTCIQHTHNTHTHIYIYTYSCYIYIYGPREHF